MVFLDELATNATARNVSIIVYSGNSDLLIPHRGSEGASVSYILRLWFSQVAIASSRDSGDHIPHHS